VTETRILHCSDLHFGRPAVPAQYEAIEDLIDHERFDVVAISGDVSQRARVGEFQRARAFIRRAARGSHVIVVPGNHDVSWWRAPLGVGQRDRLLAKYREYIDSNLEPVFRGPGITIVGLNTAHGVIWGALTWNLRDLSIIGHLHQSQVDHARDEFAKSGPGDARVVLMHHNPVKGELSQRFGLKHTRRILGAFASMGVDLVLCGHDHQEAVNYVEETKRGTIISTAGTVSDRSRGGRPSSVNTIRITPEQIEVATLVWTDVERTFARGPVRCFDR